MNTHQVSVAAESFTATLFAWAGFDVSVQYGANQPEYDLVVVSGERMLKVSVKGSQDGGWGLTQSFKKNRSYSEAADEWIRRHTGKTIVSLVQFKNVEIENDEMPRVYLATPQEIGDYMKKVRGGLGNTIVREKHIWKAGEAKGQEDAIPIEWKFSKERIKNLFEMVV
ncbi:hypothetical protein [Halobacillus sp. A5]|uniref:hypothetical protein n=1 Tax=Halobacillus sp. A5 TaxID=2880263 RepID=UPI0020A6C77B|nr:hypothetical protein [Halobacillus sp. A5]MCP3027009.1 hypothetical protein [Halobacillus sp. A5]